MLSAANNVYNPLVGGQNVCMEQCWNDFDRGNLVPIFYTTKPTWIGQEPNQGLEVI
jgi:hypothetical protein